MSKDPDEASIDPPPLRTVAAVDLGSNSFHMIVAHSDGGPLEVIDRMRERVQIAAGIDAEGDLSEEAQERAFACLERFGQRLRDFSSDRVRAVGTNTFRSARNGKNFRRLAEQALSHPIEIISGAEEARLVYLGVRRQRAPSTERQLVIDVGGGSTELIVAEGEEIRLAESVPLGCVSYSRRFFPDGKLTEAAFRAAVLAARIELRPIEEQFRTLDCTSALGSSGTAHAIQALVRATGEPHELITKVGLERVRDLLIKAGTVDAIDNDALREDRRPVIAGGVAVLLAVCKSLKFTELTATPGGVREGILHDLIGRLHHDDVREVTLERFLDRYGIDRKQAMRVERTAQSLFDAIAPSWNLADNSRLHLSWAARLHEIGLAISHQGHHKHAEYLIRNSDMAGFSTDEQELVATLVRHHRRRVSRKRLGALHHVSEEEALRLCSLLRIAVVQNRTRRDAQEPPWTLHARDATLEMRFPEGYFAHHPLTRTELFEELELAKQWGVKIKAVEGGPKK